MADKLNLTLPEKKPRGSMAGAWTLLLLVALIILACANLVVLRSGQTSAPKAAGRLSAEQARALATRLTQRELHEQAAAAWQDYLATAELTDVERARVHFQIGGLLEKAGRYADAIDHYYRSEAAAEVGELRSDINAHIKECFERLGKFAALRYEVMDRTSLDPTQPAGGKVVAEIGAEKITEARLDALLEEHIETQLATMRPFLTAEQLNEQKKQAAAQLREPQARQEFLREWLAEEVLYRQALEEKLADKPEARRLVHTLTRRMLSQQLLHELLGSKINVTDADVQTYYTANKDKYLEPARVGISHILVGDEAQAKDALKRLQDGAEFAQLAKELSQDQATKAGGGRIEAAVAKGSFVPGIGNAPEINLAIFAAGGPGLLERPFQTDKGWEIVKVEEVRPERPKRFDEVRQQVTAELLRRKTEEVQRNYLQEMMDKHKVVIHTSAWSPAQPESSGEAAPKP